MSEITNTRTDFFPGNAAAQNNRSNKMNALRRNALQRNDLERATEIDKTTQKDAKVDIPEHIKDFARIKKAVDAAPAIDKSDKIRELKAQINAGTYQVDYDALADKMLEMEF